MNPNSDDCAFPLSVVILARNEEQNIARCVNAVRWCNDVVVIDDGSADQTVQIAEAAGARVLQHKFENFAAQRNWAMEHASLRNEWVLHLDADEVVTSQLEDELRRQLDSADLGVAAFRMCRKTMMDSQWLKYSDGFPVWIMRLVRVGLGEFKSCGHGEEAVPAVAGHLLSIHEPFLHFPFSKGLADWIERHNRYSTREAILEQQAQGQVRWGDLLQMDRARRRAALRNLSRRLPFRPALRFLYQFVWKMGFLDGWAGYRFSRLMAMYEGWIAAKRRELIAAGAPQGDDNSRP